MKTGFALLTLLVAMVIAGPWLTNYSSFEIDLEAQNIPPGARFWMGSDDLGRDLFTRICYGGRISLFVGTVAALIDLGLGVLWGGVAGYRGGRLDSFLMRTADLLYALPFLLLASLLILLIGAGTLSLILALVMIGWIPLARMVRTEVMRLREMEFVQAAEVLGASPARILFRHILPNAMGTILVGLTLSVPSAIFAEAFLSFLGLGIQPPMASWGSLVHEGISAMTYYPWRFLFPVVFIVLTILAFNLIAEGLRQRYALQEVNL